jgi:hypothetical protein
MRADRPATRRSHHPAGDAPALDGGDHRLGELHPGRAQRTAVAEPGQVAEVRPGAEGGLVAGQDGDPGPVVGLERRERLEEALGGLAVHGVADVALVDAHDRDPFGNLRLGHGRTIRCPGCG